MNAVDNKQRCPEMTTIKVTVDRNTNTITIFNDGDGIPVAIHPDYNMYIPSLIFGQLLSGTNFNDSSKKGTACSPVIIKLREVEMDLELS